MGYVPPIAVQKEAGKGLEFRRKFGRGGTSVGIARGRDLSNGKAVSFNTIKRMVSYFARHEVDKQSDKWDKPSNGKIAWLLWGGDSGKEWANGIMRREGRKGKGTVRVAKNPGFIEQVIDIFQPSRDTENNAAKISTGFHGRENVNFTEVEETYQTPEHLAELGDLRELEIFTDDGKGLIPITFSKSGNAVVKLGVSTDKAQLYFVGGDQCLDWQKVLDLVGADAEKYKHWVQLGVCYSITYWTDKHHLEGPEYQKTGCEYIHEFGEEGGSKPNLVYDTLNERLMLVGGSYEVRDEGIWD